LKNTYCRITISECDRKYTTFETSGNSGRSLRFHLE